MRRRWLGLVAAGLAAASLMVGCGSEGDASPARDQVPVILTTTSILGDVVRSIVLDQARVEVLIPTGADPHDYQLSSQQAALIRSADLVVANGLSLEEGLDEVLDAAAEEGARILRVGPLLDPLPLTTGDRGGDGSGVALDPHVWMDLERMAQATGIIGGALAEIAPNVDWMAAADEYAAMLLETDDQVRAVLSAIPPERRILVTNHDSMGYFAERYGFEVVGVVIPGGSTLSDPSSSALAELVRIIRERAVPAIFTETTDAPTLAEALAADVGVAVVELYGGSLGESGSGADTLIKLHKVNAQRIVDALAP